MHLLFRIQQTFYTWPVLPGIEVDIRRVMFFATRPLIPSDIEFLDWVPYLDQPRSASHEGNENARQ